MTAHALPFPAEHKLVGFPLFLATVAVSLGTLLISLDQFIANVSIPTISGELGVSQDDGTWVITSYTVANAITVPLTGWFSQFFGRVRLFFLSAVLFAVMSLLCGLSVTFPMLILFRVLQGLVSGSLIPLSQALLLMLYPKAKGFALGMWGLVVMVGPAIGPVLGGWITYNYSWSWIFLINVPIGLIAGVIALTLLTDFESERKKMPIDILGLILLVVSVACFQITLDRGNDDDWWRSNFIRFTAITSFISFCFFIIWEKFHKFPVVDLSFFKSRNFTLGSLVIGVAMMLIFGSLIVSPIWAQGPLGYTPLWAGYSIAYFGLTAVIFFPLVGMYLNWMDPRLWIALGVGLMVPPFLFLAYLNIDTPFNNLALPRLWQGVGFAFFFVPLVTMSLAGIPEKKMPSAAGIFSFTRMLCISAGVSLSTTFYARRENFFQSRYVEAIIPSNPQFGAYFEILKTKLGLSGLHADAFVYQMVQNQAYTETFLELCYISAIAFIGLFVLIFFFRSPKKAKELALKRAEQLEE